jgi:NADH:ubiquinone reductase (non-electrogenic)
LIFGVEYAAELHDFLIEDLLHWYPNLAEKLKITLVEALPNVLPMFSKSLIDYTENHLVHSKINLLKNTSVQKVEQTMITVKDKEKNIHEIPYGLLVWATGNTPRDLVSKFIKALPPTAQNQRRGLVVSDNLKVAGCEGVFALGDASATRWAPTAQVASGQGRFLASVFNKIGEDYNVTESEILESVGPFNYNHLGSLAYIGADRAIADFPGGVESKGVLTLYFFLI